MESADGVQEVGLGYFARPEGGIAGLAVFPALVGVFPAPQVGGDAQVAVDEGQVIDEGDATLIARQLRQQDHRLF